MNTVDDVRLYTVSVDICGPCLSGNGNECHTPGCLFWMHDPPTRPVDVHNMKPA